VAEVVGSWPMSVGQPMGFDFNFGRVESLDKFHNAKSIGTI
jgi:hypothetical protein